MQYLHCTWHLNPPLEKLLFHVFVHYAAAVSFLVAKSHFRLLQKPFCRPHSILLLPCHSAMKDWTPFSPGYLLLHINHLEVFFCRIPYKEWYSSNGTNFLKNDCKIQSVVTDKCIEISNWSRFINPCKNYYVVSTSRCSILQNWLHYKKEPKISFSPPPSPVVLPTSRPCALARIHTAVVWYIIRTKPLLMPSSFCSKDVIGSKNTALTCKKKGKYWSF